MPLNRNILKTKLLEVKPKEVQRTLRALKKDHPPVLFDEDGVFVGNQKIGRIKPEYCSFVASLENPTIRLKPTGGYNQLLNEEGKAIKTYASFDELTMEQREKLSLCIYTYRQLPMGCNIEVVDEYENELMAL